MKVVFDTNVILSAFLTQGVSSRILLKCLEEYEVYISGWIIEEIKEKLENKFKIKKTDIKEFLEFIKDTFLIVEPRGKLPNKSRDKDDNNLLLLAEYVSAKVLVTGDNDLLVLKKYKKTRILNPRDFYRKYLAG